MIRTPPEQRLAEGFAQHAERWALSMGAPPEAAAAAGRAAAAASLAVSAGHVCLRLGAWARETAQPLPPLRAALLASRIVGTPAAPGAMPLLLDDDDRLYLHRYFDYERRLARRLALAAAAPPDAAAADPAVRDQLAALFAANAARLGGAADWQQLAAALALRGRLTVISGGPGTGKTTTVVNLLSCLLTLAPQARIALAAPTGKAAARMTDAVRQRAAHLAPALRERLPGEASTVHRLLGARGDGFVHGAGNPLPLDALVVDEASMLDLALATRLLEAVPATARIILLGDKDQLAAVESGAVFAELSADPSLTPACRAQLAAMTGTPAPAVAPPAPVQASPLRDVAVWFTQTYRFADDSGIGKLARLVNAGDAGQALAWLRAGGDPAIGWLEDAPGAGGRAVPAALRARLEAGYAAYLDAVAAAGADAASVTAAFGAFRALCAVREGPRGVEALNEAATRWFRAALRARGADAEPDGSPWFAGRAVIVLANDYVLRLFNGDVGIALPGPDGALLVHFPDAAAPDGFRAIAPVRLPRHETAFAMTVHKSQGSEFDEVLVVLPEARSRVLTRELLYTGITRARHRATLAAPAAALEAAVTQATVRHSGLLARLVHEFQPGPAGSARPQD